MINIKAVHHQLVCNARMLFFEGNSYYKDVNANSQLNSLLVEFHKNCHNIHHHCHCYFDTMLACKCVASAYSRDIVCLGLEPLQFFDDEYR